MKQAFALSGGGARGFAHLGIMQAFQESGIVPSAISATSAGAIAAAFLAQGREPLGILDLFSKHPVALSFRWQRKLGAFMSLKNLERLLEEELGNATFSDLNIPLFVCVTNFLTGDQEVFKEGPLIPALMAAASIPVMFPPVLIDGVPYVDGGLSSNLPVEPLLGAYPSIVGVSVNPLAEFQQHRNSFLSNLERTLHFSLMGGVLRNQQHCSLFVEPPDLKQFGLFDIRRHRDIYQTGLSYTRQFLVHLNPSQLEEAR